MGLAEKRPESFPQLNDRTHTGVEVLDSAVPNGIPRNTMIVLHGEGGTGKSVFLASIAYNRLLVGEPVLFVTLDDDPVSLLQLFESFGWKLDEYIAKNLFRVIDCFSYRVKTPGSPPNYVFRVVNPREPNDLVEALSAAMNEMGMNSKGAIFIDSLNELLSQSEITSALETVKMIRAVAPKTRRVSVYATLHTGIESLQEILFTLEYTVDGIIEFRYDPTLAQLGMPIKQLQVRKLRGTRHAAVSIPYSINSHGIRPVDPQKITGLLKSLASTSQ